MVQLEFSENDIKQMKNRGISPETVMSQVEMFQKGAPYVKLHRISTVGDGIVSISDEEIERVSRVFETYVSGRKVIKFVPASGAASRMFKTLLRINNDYDEINRDTIASNDQKGEEKRLLEFMEGIRKFAFFEDLKSVMSKEGREAEGLINDGQFKEVIEFLISEKGLEYSQLPKGLLKFHRYPDGSRTSFEEHLVEAVDYTKDENGICRLHFTVSPEHKGKFESLLESVRIDYEKKYDVRFTVGFSIQNKSTDTIAVDLDNMPFRLKDGSILFRPGGHGALIENLNAQDGDMIFIKNIDNVVPDKLRWHTILWKRVLGGHLAQIQQKIFSYLEKLTTVQVETELLKKVFNFTKNDLCVLPPKAIDLNLDMVMKDYLIRILDRPTRVCGMVRNEGEPGGGPFWVETKEGILCLQVVESSQVDLDSDEQRKILNSSTHFNPVDIVFGIKNFKGVKFDLRKYVDNEAVFISEKSKDGRNLKALELPGLWNGAMANWNTIFVEVPIVTFNPVKTINDLLRKEHLADLDG